MHIISESFLFEKCRGVSAISAISEMLPFLLAVLVRELLRIAMPFLWCRICEIMSTFEESYFRVYFRAAFPTCRQVKSNDVK